MLLKNFKEKIKKDWHIYSLYLIAILFLFSILYFFSNAAYAVDKVTFKPQVPFGDIKEGIELAQYINAIYKYLVILAGVIAGATMIFGGIKYVTSQGDSGAVSSAKSMIANSLIGLILLLSSYQILKWVNPDMTNLPDNISVTEVKGQNVVSHTVSCTKIGFACNNDNDCGSNEVCKPYNTVVVPYVKEYIPPAYIQAIEDAAVFVTDAISWASIVGGVSQNVLKVSLKGMLKAALVGVSEASMKKVATGLAKATGAVLKKSVSAGKELAFHPIKSTFKAVTYPIKKIASAITYPVRNPVKFSKMLGTYGMGGFVYQLSKGSIKLLIALNEGCESKIEKDTGKICTPGLFLYNIIPQGLAESDQEVYVEKVKMDNEGNAMFDLVSPKSVGYERLTFLYNKDGSLPDRYGMMLDKPSPYYIKYPHFTLAKTDFKYKGAVYSGQANTDACDPENNHCPCIEWEEYNQEKGIYKCKRQARCVKLKDYVEPSDLKHKNGVHPSAESTMCLTGADFEPCDSDNDCRPGARCVLMYNASVARNYNLLTKNKIGVSSFKGSHSIARVCINFKSYTNQDWDMKNMGNRVYLLGYLPSDLKFCENVSNPIWNSHNELSNCQEIQVNTQKNTWEGISIGSLLVKSQSDDHFKHVYVYPEKDQTFKKGFAIGLVNSVDQCYNTFKNISPTLLKDRIDDFFGDSNCDYVLWSPKSLGNPISYELVNDVGCFATEFKQTYKTELTVKWTLEKYAEQTLASLLKDKNAYKNKNGFCYLNISQLVESSNQQVSGMIKYVWANLSFLVSDQVVSDPKYSFYKFVFDDYLLDEYKDKAKVINEMLNVVISPN